MRYLLSTLVVALCFALTGCFDVTEEITVKKNGSGEYSVTMDLSDMMSNAFMQEAIAEELKKEGQSIEDMEIDSVATFADMDTPDDLTAAERDLLSDVYMRMNVSKTAEKMIIQIGYPFDSFEQMEQINEVINRLSERSAEAEAAGEESNNPFKMLSGLDDFNSSQSKFVLGKKNLERQTIMLDTEEEDDDEEMDEDTKAMMKMMFGDADFKTIYHMPGKVKKTTFENAEIDGKTVTVSYDLFSIMEGEADMSGSIKFK